MLRSAQDFCALQTRPLTLDTSQRRKCVLARSETSSQSGESCPLGAHMTKLEPICLVLLFALQLLPHAQITSRPTCHEKTHTSGWQNCRHATAQIFSQMHPPLSTTKFVFVEEILSPRGRCSKKAACVCVYFCHNLSFALGDR